MALTLFYWYFCSLDRFSFESFMVFRVYNDFLGCTNKYIILWSLVVSSSCLCREPENKVFRFRSLTILYTNSHSDVQRQTRRRVVVNCELWCMIRIKNTSFPLCSNSKQMHYSPKLFILSFFICTFFSPCNWIYKVSQDMDCGTNLLCGHKYFASQFKVGQVKFCLNIFGKFCHVRLGDQS